MKATDPRKKIECFDRSIELKPTADAYWYRSRVKMELNDTKGAGEDIYGAVKFDDKYMYYESGILNMTDGNYQEALSDFEESIKLGFQDAVAFRERGWAKFRAGDFSGALADLNTYVEIVPQMNTGYELRGQIKQAMKDYNGAINDYRQCYMYHDYNVMCIIGLSLAHYNIDAKSQAKSYLDMAKTLYPLLQQGMDGINALFDEVYYWTDEDKETLKKMLVELK